MCVFLTVTQCTFVDGSCVKNNDGVLVSGYAVCTVYQIVKCCHLPNVRSAQIAEFIALTSAYILANEKTVTVYTYSKYVFRVMDNFRLLRM
mgnify:CR=1 FL=1